MYVFLSQKVLKLKHIQSIILIFPGTNITLCTNANVYFCSESTTLEEYFWFKKKPLLWSFRCWHLSTCETGPGSPWNLLKSNTLKVIPLNFAMSRLARIHVIIVLCFTTYTNNVNCVVILFIVFQTSCHKFRKNDIHEKHIQFLQHFLYKWLVSENTFNVKSFGCPTHKVTVPRLTNGNLSLDLVIIFWRSYQGICAQFDIFKWYTPTWVRF